MRTPADALRSFKRHVALSLGPEWEVRLTGEEGAFSRPFARVGMPGDARLTGPAAWTVFWRAGFEVVAHPIETATPDEATLEAARVKQLLFAALRTGGAAPGRPKRVPLWDYEGVAPTEDVTDDPDAAAANPGLVLRPRDERDFLRADAGDEPTVSGYQDAEDEMLHVVTAAITMSWWAPAAVPSPGVTVQRVNANNANPPAEAP